MGFATLILSTFLYYVSKFIVCAYIAGIRSGVISTALSRIPRFRLTIET